MFGLLLYMQKAIRAFSSVGRASPLQGEGQKFESSSAHHKKQDDISYPVFYFVVLMTRVFNCVSNLIKSAINNELFLVFLILISVLGKQHVTFCNKTDKKAKVLKKKCRHES